jgi:hypothetical protein
MELLKTQPKTIPVDPPAAGSSDQQFTTTAKRATVLPHTNPRTTIGWQRS